MTKERFNVIVVGGGPVGLTAAHTLSKAGIDFTILERRETILEDIGATIFLWPQGMRILAQLGLLESLREIGLEPQLGSQQEHNGLMFGTINSPEWCNEHFNVWPLTMARADLVKRLYDSLPDDARSHIHANKKVTSITPLSESGGGQRMRVACADGSIYDGTIVIGADGVHSAVRKAMAIAPEFPFQAKYRVLWFHYPRVPETEATIVFEVHGKGLMLQILSTETSSFALLYQRLDKPYRGYVRYGDEDMEALAAKAGFLPVGKKGRTLRDVWAIRTKAGMANLEEGYLKKVYEGGRMVVIGDAAHKVTPHSGLGLNEGISDVVSLVNELSRALQAGLEEGKVPVERELESAFARHQKTRMPAIKRGNQVSWLSVRQGTWRNKGLWLMDRVVLKMPGVDRFVFRKVVVPLIQQGLVLDCVEEQDEPFAGKTAWKNPIKGVKGKV